MTEYIRKTTDKTFGTGAFTINRGTVCGWWKEDNGIIEYRYNSLKGTAKSWGEVETQIKKYLKRLRITDVNVMVK